MKEVLQLNFKIHPTYYFWVCCSTMVLKTYLIKAEASINHAFVVMPETFLTWVTIVILPASFTPIFGIDLIIILPWVTNVLKSKKVLLVYCLVYSFKSASADICLDLNQSADVYVFWYHQLIPHSTADSCWFLFQINYFTFLFKPILFYHCVKFNKKNLF